MSVGDNLAGLIPELPLRSAQLVTVVGTGADPVYAIVSDGTTQWTVACLDGYRRRTAGDVVLAIQLSGGDWVVLGKISADDTVVADFSWGVGNPPTAAGYRKSTQLWQAVNPDGSVSLYADMTSAAPAPDIVASTDAATWAGTSGSRAALVSSSTQIATWYYGGRIAAACASKSVTSMKVRITRTIDSGSNDSAPLRLGLHGNGAYGQPMITSPWDPQVQIAQGQTVTVDIPPAQAALLASGGAQGVAATGADQFVEYATTAPVLITFG